MRRIQYLFSSLIIFISCETDDNVTLQQYNIPATLQVTASSIDLVEDKFGLHLFISFNYDQSLFEIEAHSSSRFNDLSNGRIYPILTEDPITQTAGQANVKPHHTTAVAFDVNEFEFALHGIASGDPSRVKTNYDGRLGIEHLYITIPNGLTTQFSYLGAGQDIVNLPTSGAAVIMKYNILFKLFSEQILYLSIKQR